MEQPQYNLLVREKVEKEFYNLCANHGLGLTTYSPLKMGLLSGKYNDLKVPEGSRLSTSSDPFSRALREKFNTDEEMKKQIAIIKNLEVFPLTQHIQLTYHSLLMVWCRLSPKNSASPFPNSQSPGSSRIPTPLVSSQELASRNRFSRTCRL